MNYIEYKFTLSSIDPWRDILVAYLSEGNFDSFEDTEYGVNAFVQTQLDHEGFVKQVLDELTQVEINYTRTEIEQVNWNEVWESNFQPILVNDQCYIRAEFHEKKPEIPYEVIIQPKMSFGTGHHETTHLMVEYILEVDLKDKSVLDMGCGTSILGILAKMRGAKYVEGIDIDEWSIENSIENAERNQVELTVKLGDASILGETTFDTIIANINKNILMADIPKYVEVLHSTHGELLLSGLMYFDFDDIVAKCEECGLELISKKQRNEWIALHFKIK